MRSVSGKSQIRNLLAEVLYDESRFVCGTPEVVFFPESVADLKSIISEASKASRQIVFAGAQTGITGGAVPTEDCFLISFSAMNKIKRVHWKNQDPILFCEPGVTLSSINNFCASPSNWPYCVEGKETLPDTAFFFPPDPTESNAQLGGAVATNASGARSFHFGSIRKHIEYLHCILSSGDSLQIQRSAYLSTGSGFSIISEQNTPIFIPHPSYKPPEVKNSAGYFTNPNLDLIDLFIGSEGTLAAIAEIGIKLHRKIDILSGMTFFDTALQAFDFADFLRKDPQIASIEYFDASALTFLQRQQNHLQKNIPQFPHNKFNAILWEFIENNPDPFESRLELWEKNLLQSGSSFEMTWSGFDKSGLEILKNIRYLIPELVNSTIAQCKRNYPGIRKISTDTSIPQNHFRQVFQQYVAIMEKTSLPYVIFGHLGDFHLHINVLPSNENEFRKALHVYEQLMSVTIHYCGTVSAEHGIGRLKKKYLHQMYNEMAIKKMHEIKSILDRSGIFNSENLF